MSRPFSSRPHVWAILKIIPQNAEPIFKLLAGWFSNPGQLYAVRTNSGIVRVQDNGDVYLFHGSSGSTYLCAKAMYDPTFMPLHAYLNLALQATLSETEVEIFDEKAAFDWCSAARALRGRAYH